MAKRAPVDEQPFRPLNASTLQSVLRHVPSAPEPAPVTPTAQVPAIAPTRERQPSTVLSPRSGSPLDQEKRILFTREETRALDRLVGTLAERLQTSVKASHLFRALTALVLPVERQIERCAAERGALVRPPNGDLPALQAFEKELAGLVAEALRRSGN
jgi:hypothetical protein